MNTSMCLPLKLLRNGSADDYSSTLISTGAAVGVSIIISSTAVVLILALRLYTKLVYRITLYQILCAVLVILSWEIYLATKYIVPPWEKYVIATVCVFFVYVYQIISTWIVLHLFALAVYHKNLSKLEPLYVCSSVLISSIVAAVSLALVLTANSDVGSTRCVAFQIFLLKNWTDAAFFCVSNVINCTSVIIIGLVLCRRAYRKRNGYRPPSEQQHKKALCEMSPLLMYPMFAVVTPALFEVMNIFDHSVDYRSRVVIPIIIWGIAMVFLLGILSHLGVVIYLKWQNVSRHRALPSINGSEENGTLRESSHIVIRSTTCHPGYTVSGYVCNDINECALQSTGCSQLCINTAGSFMCRCTSGYKLAYDDKTCYAPSAVIGLVVFNCSFTMITLKWQPPPYPIGEIITYQVTYTVNGSVDINAYNSTTPLMVISGLKRGTNYIFSVVGYTRTGPGVFAYTNATTATIPKVEGVAVSTFNGTSVQITWMAIYLPSDGILIGYTVYYCPPSSSLSGLLALCSSHSFPPNVTSAIITNLIQNGVYQFGIVADVAIMNLLLQGDIPQTGSTIMIDGNPVSNIAATIGESLIIGGALGGLFTLAILIATVVIAMQLWKRFRSISVNTSVPNRDGIAMKEIYAEVQDNNPNHFSEKESETHIYDAAVCATGQYNNSDQISTNECEAYGCFDYNATVKPEENIYAN
ncbi:hypothetical protein EMCRGX_G013588 [Ephydatia muelleri]